MKKTININVRLNNTNNKMLVINSLIDSENFEGLLPFYVNGEFCYMFVVGKLVEEDYIEAAMFTLIEHEVIYKFKCNYDNYSMHYKGNLFSYSTTTSTNFLAKLDITTNTREIDANGLKNAIRLFKKKMRCNKSIKCFYNTFLKLNYS